MLEAVLSQDPLPAQAFPRRTQGVPPMARGRLLVQCGCGFVST
ncbi:hypothetical protein SGL43_07091 [Streptomyces globisporus]|uniref:Uncharacterized protein n=1 Tax=Streptomyces globisporus TaxID=1908 RepID=A0ABN8VE93_STRGL|nr:hypothetical protein SGL43_07091 [Streptomyces globisporus]